MKVRLQRDKSNISGNTFSSTHIAKVIYDGAAAVWNPVSDERFSRKGGTRSLYRLLLNLK